MELSAASSRLLIFESDCSPIATCLPFSLIRLLMPTSVASLTMIVPGLQLSFVRFHVIPRSDNPLRFLRLFCDGLAWPARSRALKCRRRNESNRMPSILPSRDVIVVRIQCKVTGSTVPAPLACLDDAGGDCSKNKHGCTSVSKVPV